MQIERAGIAKATARQAVDEVFGAHRRRRRCSNRRCASGCAAATTIADDREFQRLYRYLVGQGFESDRVLAALNARRRN